MADLERLRALLDLAALEHPYWAAVRDAAWEPLGEPHANLAACTLTTRFPVREIYLVDRWCARALPVSRLDAWEDGTGLIDVPALIARLEHGAPAK